MSDDALPFEKVPGGKSGKNPFNRGKVVKRAETLPLAEYEDGEVDFAWPGGIYNPLMKLYQGLTTPTEHTRPFAPPEEGEGLSPELRELGMGLGGLVSVAGLLGRKPFESLGMGGMAGGKGKGLAPLDWQERGIKGLPWKDGFYSPSLTAAVNLKQAKGTWTQMRAQLLKEGGKPKELAASGIDEHFKPEQVVSREEIAVYLAEHRIETQKRVYDQDQNDYDTSDRDYFDEDGDPLPDSDFHRYSDYKSPGGEGYQETVVGQPVDAKLKGEIAALEREYKAKIDKYEALVSSVSGDVARAARDRRDALVREWRQKQKQLEQQQETKYASGHWPGVKNPLFHYRTQEYNTFSPEAIPKVEAYDAMMPRERELAEAMSKAQAARDNDVRAQRTAALDELRKRYDERNKDGGYNYHNWGSEPYRAHEKEVDEIDMRRFPTEHDAAVEAAEKAWKEFHDQMPERISWGDEKTLLLDELQSDWAQQGRKHGFRDEKKLEAAQKEFDEIVEQIQGEQWPKPGSVPSADYDRSIHRRAALDTRLREAAEIINGEQRSGKKAQAPYVTNTDDWVSFALKHALLDAARGKANRLAWAPGEAQAGRYGGGNGRAEGMENFYGNWQPPIGDGNGRQFGAYAADQKTGGVRFAPGGILGKNLFDILKKVDPEAAKALKIEPVPIGGHSLSRSSKPGKWDVEHLDRFNSDSYTDLPFREALEKLAEENPAYPSVQLPQALRERILAEGLPLWLNPSTAAGPGMVMGGAAQQSPFTLGPGQTEEEPAPLRGSFRQRYPEE